MIYIRYTCKQVLVSGHVVNEIYELSFPLKERDHVYKNDRTIVYSMSGTPYITYRHRKRIYNLEFPPLNGDDYLGIREIQHSIRKGEVFDIKFGSGDTYMQCISLDDSLSEARAVRRGDGGGSDYFIYKMSIMVI